MHEFATLNTNFYSHPTQREQDSESQGRKSWDGEGEREEAGEGVRVGKGKEDGWRCARIVRGTARQGGVLGVEERQAQACKLQSGSVRVRRRIKDIYREMAGALNTNFWKNNGCS